MPNSKQSAIARVIRARWEKKAASPPAEAGEPEIGQGRRQGDEPQPRFSG
jgi:hypothetical protein